MGFGLQPASKVTCVEALGPDVRNCPRYWGWAINVGVVDPTRRKSASGGYWWYVPL